MDVEYLIIFFDGSAVSLLPFHVMLAIEKHEDLRPGTDVI